VTGLGPWRFRAWLIGATLLVMWASTASAQFSYDLENYRQFVSNGAWWVHASASNNTSQTVRWRVSYSSRRCTTWSGAVSMVRAASGSLGYDSCQTASASLTHSLAPFTSAALMRRDVSNLNYYRVRKYDSTRRHLIATGFATERSTYQEYAFSGHN